MSQQKLYSEYYAKKQEVEYLRGAIKNERNLRTADHKIYFALGVIVGIIFMLALQYG